MERDKQIIELAPAIRMLANSQTPGIVQFCKEIVKDGSESPKKETMILLDGCDIDTEFEEYYQKTCTAPRIIAVKGCGFFALGKDYKSMLANKEAYINNFDFETETASEASGRMQGRICIVTGAAQGFGKGIATNIAKEGGYVVIADMNLDGAKACAQELNEAYGKGTAFAVEVNVSKDQSVENMINETVLHYGGLDVLVANAGIAIAGDLTEMTREKFELVTSVNYTGYFLCTKYATVPMKIQTRYNSNYWLDIIEINSKSGLEGSKKNYAYSGSKFGGIGLTQSFALELVEHSIKVNAICPGNLLDGPLWSDPEKGLFKQYFEAGKVPGATSIADVRRYYESRVPMNRGCTEEDVAKAIFYIVEQKYETGQALPVTGGQVMLK